MDTVKSHKYGSGYFIRPKNEYDNIFTLESIYNGSNGGTILVEKDKPITFDCSTSMDDNSTVLRVIGKDGNVKYSVDQSGTQYSESEEYSILKVNYIEQGSESDGIKFKSPLKMIQLTNKVPTYLTYLDTSMNLTNINNLNGTSVSTLISNSHTHSNLTNLNYIDQNLSTSGDVQFDNVKCGSLDLVIPDKWESSKKSNEKKDVTINVISPNGSFYVAPVGLTNYVTGALKFNYIDSYGRPQILFDAKSNLSEIGGILRLGSCPGDGDGSSTYNLSQGIVIFGNSLNDGNMGNNNWCYARIKPYRYGLYGRSIDYDGYIYKVDILSDEFYLKTNTGTKVFDIVRSTGEITFNNHIKISGDTLENLMTSSNLYLKGGVGGSVMAKEYFSCYEASDVNKRIDMYYDNGATVQTGILMLSRDYYSLKILGGSDSTVSPNIVMHGGTYESVYNPNNATSEIYSNELKIRRINNVTDYVNINPVLSTFTINNLSTVMLPNEKSIINQVSELSGLYETYVNGFRGTKPVITYDYSTQTITVNHPFVYYNQSVKYVSTENKTGIHIASSGLYYFYFSNSTGTISSGTIFPDLNSNCMIAYVFYSNVGAIANEWRGASGIMFDERHGISNDSNIHKYLHFSVGTSLITPLGGVIAPLLDTNTLAALTPTISTATIMDEDLVKVISENTTSIGVNNQYTIFYNFNGTWRWYTTNLMFMNNGTNPVYNNVFGSSLDAITANSEFFNMYLCATNWHYDSSSHAVPVVNGFFCIMGQAKYTTKNLALAETLNSLNLVNLPALEIIPLYQICYERKNSYTTVGTYYCAITAATRIVDKKISINQTSTTVHNSLTGRSDLNCHPTSALDTSVIATGTIVSGGTLGLDSSGVIVKNTMPASLTASCIGFGSVSNTLTGGTDLTWDGTHMELSETSRSIFKTSHDGSAGWQAWQLYSTAGGIADTSVCIGIQTMNYFGTGSSTNGAIVGHNKAVNAWTILTLNGLLGLDFTNSYIDLYKPSVNYNIRYYDEASSSLTIKDTNSNNYVQLYGDANSGSTSNGVLLRGTNKPVRISTGNFDHYLGNNSTHNIGITDKVINFKQNGINKILFPRSTDNKLYILDSLEYNGLSISLDGTLAGLMQYSAANHAFYKQVSSTGTLTFDFGISNAGDNWSFTNSTVYYSGSLANWTSKRELKENIVDIPKEEYEKIYELIPRKFNFKTAKYQTQYGFIVEEAAVSKNDILYEVEYLDKDNNVWNVNYDSDGKIYSSRINKETRQTRNLDSNWVEKPSSISYIEVIPCLVACLKDHKNKHDDKDKKIKDHEERIKKLEHGNYTPIDKSIKNDYFVYKPLEDRVEKLENNSSRLMEQNRIIKLETLLEKEIKRSDELMRVLESLKEIVMDQSTKINELEKKILKIDNEKKLKINL